MKKKAVSGTLKLSKKTVLSLDKQELIVGGDSLVCQVSTLCAIASADIGCSGVKTTKDTRNTSGATGTVSKG